MVNKCNKKVVHANNGNLMLDLTHSCLDRSLIVSSATASFLKIS